MSYFSIRFKHSSDILVHADPTASLLKIRWLHICGEIELGLLAGVLLKGRTWLTWLIISLFISNHLLSQVDLIKWPVIVNAPFMLLAIPAEIHFTYGDIITATVSPSTERRAALLSRTPTVFVATQT